MVFIIFTLLIKKVKQQTQLSILLLGENQDLGIVKRQRKSNIKLIVAAFPEKQRGSNQFFFQASSQSLLTITLQPCTP
ncbi:hypothetical protein NUACC26_062130 [Scytonema sp. NUACC26]